LSEQPQTKRKGPSAQEIASRLRAAIKAGEYQPGAKLPSEAVLAEEYGVARGTVRDAFNKLHAEWITEARRGSGTYVRTFKPMRRNAAERLARKNWDAGRAIWETDDGDRSTREVVASKQIDAPPHVAAGFGMTSGKVWEHRVRHFIDGRLVQYAVSYLPVDLVGDAGAPPPNVDVLGTFALLRDLGHAPTRVREELRSRLPIADESDALGVTGQTPVLLIAQTAFDDAGRPVGITELILDSSSYLLEYEFSV
jgi:GntR family transcriptional regulator